MGTAVGAISRCAGRRAGPADGRPLLRNGRKRQPRKAGRSHRSSLPSRPTTYGTPQPVWRSVRTRMSKRCNGCPAMPASMTLDTYADLFDTDLDAVADNLDAAIRSD